MIKTSMLQSLCRLRGSLQYLVVSVFPSSEFPTCAGCACRWALLCGELASAGCAAMFSVMDAFSVVSESARAGCACLVTAVYLNAEFLWSPVRAGGAYNVLVCYPLGVVYQSFYE